MGLQSKNMNYVFNVEYFKNINLAAKDDSASLDKLKERNGEIVAFRFFDVAPLSECKDIPGYREFSLYTLYPGLLVGTGNPHEIAMKEALKLGFSFDYVTGLPYIPASSLKGMLRAYFPGDTKDAEKEKEYDSLIRALLEEVLKKDGIAGSEKVDVKRLKASLFENNDIFLGAFPVPSESGFGNEKGKLLDLEYITPHKEKFKNPNPISLIKVRPAVKFTFAGVFSDYEEDGAVLVTGAQKAELCKELLMLFGIGAKTNTGYGRFSEKKPVMQNLLPRATAAPVRERNGNRSEGRKDTNGFSGNRQEGNGARCKNCGKPVKINPKTQKPHTYCWECNQNRNRF